MFKGSYRTEEISFEKEGELLRIVLPKFSQIKVYHATTGIDFMKETEEPEKEIVSVGNLKVSERADSVEIEIRISRVKGI